MNFLGLAEDEGHNPMPLAGSRAASRDCGANYWCCYVLVVTKPYVESQKRGAISDHSVRLATTHGDQKKSRFQH